MKMKVDLLGATLEKQAGRLWRANPGRGRGNYHGL
jgi:hypothetical protein